MNKTMTVLLVTLLCFFNICCSQNSTSAYIQQNDLPEENWKQFDFEENNFSIWFPEEPKIEKQEINSPNGKFVVTTYFVEQPKIGYAVSVTTLPVKIDYSNKTKEVLNKTKDDTVAQYKGTLTEESDIKINRFQGKEFSFTTQDSIWKDQLYLADEKIYLVFVQIKTLDNQQNQDQNKLLKKYFDSFKLITNVS